MNLQCSSGLIAAIPVERRGIESWWGLAKYLFSFPSLFFSELDIVRVMFFNS